MQVVNMGESYMSTLLILNKVKSLLVKTLSLSQLHVECGQEVSISPVLRYLKAFSHFSRTLSNSITPSAGSVSWLWL